ncbi:unnamed protein product, partial [Pylaiella littoralis]
MAATANAAAPASGSAVVDEVVDAKPAWGSSAAAAAPAATAAAAAAAAVTEGQQQGGGGGVGGGNGPTTDHHQTQIPRTPTRKPRENFRASPAQNRLRDRGGPSTPSGTPGIRGGEGGRR